MREQTRPKIKMLNGYVLMKDEPIDENVTESGIILPKTVFQRFAKIYAVGKDSKFKAGDTIVKPIGKSTPVTINDVEYECIKESLIFAKL